MVRVVAFSEYGRRMRQRGFVLGSLLVPLLVVVAIAIAGFLSASAESVGKPLGVVDLAGVLSDPQPLPEAGAPEFVLYHDAEAARRAVDDGVLDAAFVIAPNYSTTREVTSYSPGDLPRQARDGFRAWLRWNLAQPLPEGQRERASKGVDLVVRSLDGRREFSESSWPNVVIPFLAAILFFMIVISSSGNALSAVVDEKETRTMEIIVTSISPNEIMAGKIAAIFAIGLTQMLAWAVVVAVGLVVARQHFEELSAFRLDWSYVVLIAATFLPAYVLIASLLAAIGSIASETREGSQLSVLVTLPTFVPAWFTPLIISNPNGLASVALTMFPLTAPLTLSIRWAFTSIPVWQLLLSLGLLLASAVGSVFLAARVFRAGMLRYGQRLSWDEVRRAIRGQTA